MYKNGDTGNSPLPVGEERVARFHHTLLMPLDCGCFTCVEPVLDIPSTCATS